MNEIMNSIDPIVINNLAMNDSFTITGVYAQKVYTKTSAYGTSSVVQMNNGELMIPPLCQIFKRSPSECAQMVVIQKVGNLLSEKIVKSGLNSNRSVCIIGRGVRSGCDRLEW